MEFPWRCNVDTIAMDLKVSWEMSVIMGLSKVRIINQRLLKRKIRIVVAPHL